MEGLRRSMSGVFTPRKKTPPPPTKGASPPPPPPPPDGDDPRPTFSEPPPPEAAKLLSSSDILAPAHVAALEPSLPATLRGYNWKRLYSLQQHGANAGTFYARVQFEARTLVVAETSAGEILGGYTNAVWRPGAEYYGTGQSFLFKVERQASKKIAGPITVRHGEIRPFQEGDFPTVYAMKRPPDWPPPPEASGGDGKDAEPRHTPDGRRIWRTRGTVLDIIPDPPDDDGPRVACFPWTGANNYFMMCSESSIAMGGGGGSFGFFLDDDFSRGSSGPSETYGNPPLAASSEFDVVNFECWGFTTHVDADAAAKEDRCRVGRPRPVVALLS